MRQKTTSWLPVAFLCLTTLSHGADLTEIPAPGPAVPQDELRHALTERAILYEIRAAFDVMDDTAIEGTLAADARRLAATSFFDEERSYAQQDLLAEGSYYIVSLSYLVLARGANWPADRAASVYERDAEVKLETLKQRWIGSIDVGDTDALLGIMRETDTINAWTEGQPSTTEEFDHFDNIEGLVAAALGEVR